MAAIFGRHLGYVSTEGVSDFDKDTNEVVDLQTNLNGVCKLKYGHLEAILDI